MAPAPGCPLPTWLVALLTLVSVGRAQFTDGTYSEKGAFRDNFVGWPWVQGQQRPPFPEETHSSQIAASDGGQPMPVKQPSPMVENYSQTVAFPVEVPVVVYDAYEDEMSDDDDRRDVRRFANARVKLPRICSSKAAAARMRSGSGSPTPMAEMLEIEVGGEEEVVPISDARLAERILACWNIIRASLGAETTAMSVTSKAGNDNKPKEPKRKEEPCWNDQLDKLVTFVDRLSLVKNRFVNFLDAVQTIGNTIAQCHSVLRRASVLTGDQVNGFASLRALGDRIRSSTVSFFGSAAARIFSGGGGGGGGGYGDGRGRVGAGSFPGGVTNDSTSLLRVKPKVLRSVSLRRAWPVCGTILRRGMPEAGGGIPFDCFKDAVQKFWERFADSFSNHNNGSSSSSSLSPGMRYAGDGNRVGGRRQVRPLSPAGDDEENRRHDPPVAVSECDRNHEFGRDRLAVQVFGECVRKLLPLVTPKEKFEEARDLILRYVQAVGKSLRGLDEEFPPGELKDDVEDLLSELEEQHLLFEADVDNVFSISGTIGAVPPQETIGNYLIISADYDGGPDEFLLWIKRRNRRLPGGRNRRFLSDYFRRFRGGSKTSDDDRGRREMVCNGFDDLDEMEEAQRTTRRVGLGAGIFDQRRRFKRSTEDVGGTTTRDSPSNRRRRKLRRTNEHDEKRTPAAVKKSKTDDESQNSTEITSPQNRFRQSSEMESDRKTDENTDSSSSGNDGKDRTGRRTQKSGLTKSFRQGNHTTKKLLKNSDIDYYNDGSKIVVEVPLTDEDLDALNLTKSEREEFNKMAEIVLNVDDAGVIEGNGYFKSAAKHGGAVVAREKDESPRKEMVSRHQDDDDDAEVEVEGEDIGRETSDWPSGNAHVEDAEENEVHELPMAEKYDETRSSDRNSKVHNLEKQYIAPRVISRWHSFPKDIGLAGLEDVLDILGSEGVRGLHGIGHRRGGRDAADTLQALKAAIDSVCEVLMGPRPLPDFLVEGANLAFTFVVDSIYSLRQRLEIQRYLEYVISLGLEPCQLYTEDPLHLLYDVLAPPIELYIEGFLRAGNATFQNLLRFAGMGPPIELEEQVTSLESEDVDCSKSRRPQRRRNTSGSNKGAPFSWTTNGNGVPPGWLRSPSAEEPEPVISSPSSNPRQRMDKSRSPPDPAPAAPSSQEAVLDIAGGSSGLSAASSSGSIGLAAGGGRGRANNNLLQPAAANPTIRVKFKNTFALPGGGGPAGTSDSADARRAGAGLRQDPHQASATSKVDAGTSPSRDGFFDPEPMAHDEQPEETGPFNVDTSGIPDMRNRFLPHYQSFFRNGLTNNFRFFPASDAEGAGSLHPAVTTHGPSSLMMIMLGYIISTVVVFLCMCWCATWFSRGDYPTYPNKESNSSGEDSSRLARQCRGGVEQHRIKTQSCRKNVDDQRGGVQEPPSRSHASRRSKRRRLPPIRQPDEDPEDYVGTEDGDRVEYKSRGRYRDLREDKLVHPGGEKMESSNDPTWKQSESAGARGGCGEFEWPRDYRHRLRTSPEEDARKRLRFRSVIPPPREMTDTTAMGGRSGARQMTNRAGDDCDICSVPQPPRDSISPVKQRQTVTSSSARQARTEPGFSLIRSNSQILRPSSRFDGLPRYVPGPNFRQ